MINRFTGAHSFLSNFYFSGRLVHYDDDPYSTVEHAYQAAKVESRAERREIHGCHTPGAAKRWGQRVILRDGWDDIKREIMLELLREKFFEDPLRAKLAATRPHDLVEGNTWGDTYWGVCGGVGENWLGRLLMRVREEIA